MNGKFLKLNENANEKVIIFGFPTASVGTSSVLGPLTPSLTPYKKPAVKFFDYSLKRD